MTIYTDALEDYADASDAVETPLIEYRTSNVAFTDVQILSLTLVVTDSVAFVNTAIGTHVGLLSDTFALTDTLTASAVEVETLTDSFATSDVLGGELTASVLEAVVLAETIASDRTSTLTEQFAVFTTTGTGTTQTVIDAFDFGDTTNPIPTSTQTDVANLTDTLIGQRIVGLIVTDTLNVAPTLTDSNRSTLLLDDEANFSESTALTTAVTETLSSSVDFVDTTRLPSTATPIFWINTATGACSTWNSLPLNSMIDADGEIYAAGVDGIVKLTDTLTRKIESSVTWDLSNFGSVQKKGFASAYISGVGKFTVSTVNTQGRFRYPAKPVQGGQINHRAELGRGLTSVYTRFTLAADGACDVKAVNIEVTNWARKI